MKKNILFLIITFLSSAIAFAEDTFFQYPQAPESLNSLSQRANYVVIHFWDKCNLKSAFSSRKKMKKAFIDYVTYMQYASSDTIYTSIDKLIKEVQKSPKNMLYLAEIAEETLYSDSALFWSDELYLPFATAITQTKKISKAEKARYAHQATVLKNSSIGTTAPSFEYTTPNGNKQHFDSIKAPAIILFFNDPDCIDCRLAKVRLATDTNLNKLIDAGVIKIASIYPGIADDSWKNEVADYPKNWIIGACENIYELFDMRTTPSIYQLDNKHKIVAKNLNVDGILMVVNNIKL
ncbi:MAG: DUF5106 domain-containing protein [Bacteroidales bacterium]|nr:DUF5106 domain-containing protein [Bacteroidales bacterium]